MTLIRLVKIPGGESNTPGSTDATSLDNPHTRYIQRQNKEAEVLRVLLRELAKEEDQLKPGEVLELGILDGQPNGHIKVKIGKTERHLSEWQSLNDIIPDNSSESQEILLSALKSCIDKDKYEIANNLNAAIRGADGLRYKGYRCIEKERLAAS